MKQNYASFSEYFDSDSKKKVVSFTNLNKDAVLIAPMPKNDDDYKNISEFTKNASEQRQKSF
jgi:anthranilate/para-aminobenzoate synthase component II